MLHFKSAAVLLILVIILCNSVFISCRGTPTSRKSEQKVESRTVRGQTKFLLPQPSFKNSEYQVTPTTITPIIKKETRAKQPKKKNVRSGSVSVVSNKSEPQSVQKSPGSDLHEIQKFPSLAGLVFLEPTPTPKPSTTTERASVKSKRTTTVAPKKRNPQQKTKSKPTKSPIKNTKQMVSDFTCPKPDKIPFQWFPLPCDSHKQCRSMGKSYRCCAINSNSYKTCTKGLLKEIPEEKHIPLFGVPVKCPKVPLAELFWNVQSCETDSDCWPRVCCPDGRKKFCRSPSPEFKEARNPLARQLTGPFKSATSFIQCTAPSRFDVHPKPCNTTLECFPNICCQEGAKRHCRPPQKSLFSMVANSVSQTLFGN